MRNKSKNIVGTLFMTSISLLALNQNVLADCIRDNPDKYGFDAKYSADNAKLTIKTSKGSYECKLSQNDYVSSRNPKWSCDSNIQIQTGKAGWQGISKKITIYANGEKHKLWTKVDETKCILDFDYKGNLKILRRTQYPEGSCRWQVFKNSCNEDHQLVTAKSTYILKERKEKEVNIFWERRMDISLN